MSKLTIGVGDEFPLDETPSGQDRCAQHRHHHHRRHRHDHPAKTGDHPEGLGFLMRLHHRLHRHAHRHMHRHMQQPGDGQ